MNWEITKQEYDNFLSETVKKMNKEFEKKGISQVAVLDYEKLLKRKLTSEELVWLENGYTLQEDTSYKGLAWVKL